jgi:chromosome segregation ATPase
MMADDLIRELRQAAERRAETSGPFTARNLVEWRAADALASKDKALEGMRAELETARKEIEAADADRSAARAGQQVAVHRATTLESQLERVKRDLAMSEASAELRLRRLMDANNELEEFRAAARAQAEGETP